MSIGHPDFLGAVSPSPPQFLAALGPFGGGVAWGPVSVPMISGGSYQLIVFPIQTADFQCTDITVTHLDSRAVPVYQDFFGGVLCGNALPGVAGNANASVCRGNIYGNTLQISGLSATAAFLNAVMPGNAFVGTGLNINVYSTPFALDDPQPKVTVAAAQVAAGTGLTPQGLIAAMTDQSVAISTTTPAKPFLSYAGPAVLEITQVGVTTGANCNMRVLGYTVANGSAAPVTRRRYQPLANQQVNVFQVNLAPMLHTWVFQNSDINAAAVVDMLLSAGKAA